MKNKILPLPPKIRAAYNKLLDAQQLLKNAYPLYSFTLDGKLIVI